MYWSAALHSLTALTALPLLFSLSRDLVYWGMGSPWSAAPWAWGLWSLTLKDLGVALTHSGSQFTAALNSLSVFTLAPLEIGAPWGLGLWSFTLQGPGGCWFSLTLAPNSLLLWTLHSLTIHPGIRGSMGPGFVVPLDSGHSKDLGVAGSPQLSLTLLH